MYVCKFVAPNFFIWRQSKPGCHCLTWVQFYLAMEGGGLFLVFSSRPAFLDDALGGGRDCCDHKRITSIPPIDVPVALAAKV